MQRSLFIIQSDPRTSHRPAEAIRIAAGVGTWKKTTISIYLSGPAVLAMGEYVDELVDEDNYTRYFPIVKDFGRPIYVEKGNPFLKELGDSPFEYQEVDNQELASLCMEQNSVLNF
ncbi:MAG: hypothetical protein JWN25_2740 [Verrucomicrobiales bacterium]|jgi:sulfur relay (sulfurtransferase) DsrF/TusC family protein|nr:hypothetical protein [Verrucomicrobiales bacterium]MDB6131075.1 hypothetical protein [Verrucomicrobiales bacterium]